MSFESAVQRMSELASLTQTAPVRGAITPAAASDQFSKLLQAQMQQAAPAGATLSLPASSPASGVPLYSMPGAPGLYGPGAIQPPWLDQLGGVGQKIVQLARGELGVTEAPPGSNDSSRIREFRSATKGAVDTPGPWCAYFVSWLAKEAGAPIGANGDGTGYVPTLESWGRSTNRFSESAKAARPGDIVIIDWGGDGTADHTGIVERVDPDGTVHTIEGNTSNAVRRRTYEPGSNEIRGFVRVG
jgi:hypothetical protein